MAKNFYRFGYNFLFCLELERLIQQDGTFNFSYSHRLASWHDMDSMYLVQYSFKLMLDNNCTREVVETIEKIVKSRNKLKQFRQGRNCARGQLVTVGF